MEFVWGRYSGLFYAAVCSLILIFISFLLGGYWVIGAFVAFCFLLRAFLIIFRRKEQFLAIFHYWEDLDLSLNL